MEEYLQDNYNASTYGISYNNIFKIDDIIYGEGCGNDGLHPSDYVQKLIFQNLIQTLHI